MLFYVAFAQMHTNCVLTLFIVIYLVVLKYSKASHGSGPISPGTKAWALHTIEWSGPSKLTHGSGHPK